MTPVARVSCLALNGLRILLTNDDGFDAPGLKAMKPALAAAGHRVTVIAPAADQSNAGTRASATPVKVEQKADDTWAVHGSPVDSVNIAIRHRFGARFPAIATPSAITCELCS